MPKSQDFFNSVWEVVMLVPYGRVTSYGAIARYLGASKSSRIVGYAMNASHQNEIKIPAHRVVNRNGLLTGKFHFETNDMMQILLEKEGIKIKNDQIEDFEKYFWDPNLEL